MSEAKPFVKWVGGKRQLIPELVKHLPAKRPYVYHERFVGGGALFFHVMGNPLLRPAKAYLTDKNQRLIRTYRAIRDDVAHVILALEICAREHDHDFFERMRERDVDKESDVEVATWFIYLNRTCFNGLYRVNKRGVFNTPFGRYQNPLICDRENLLACSRALAGVGLVTCDFSDEVNSDPKRVDFVYYDPPYVPLSATSDFTSYTDGGFSDDDQVRLRDLARRQKALGVHVLLSNSSAQRVHELYREGFTVREVSARRSVNSKGDGRGAVKEVVIT